MLSSEGFLILQSRARLPFASACAARILPWRHKLKCQAPVAISPACSRNPTPYRHRSLPVHFTGPEIPRTGRCRGHIRRTAQHTVAAAGMTAPPAGHQAPQHAAVVGAGIIGSATAYYLSKRGVKVTLIERAGVACAASGKAGGFLALDWNDGSPVGDLARLSYKAHQQLAKELGRDVGYRQVNTLSMKAASLKGKSSYKTPKGGVPAWVDGNVTSIKEMAGPDTTAQVHPKKLSEALVAGAQELGATLRIGEVQGVKHDGHKVQGVVVDGEHLDCDAVVIAMGPWASKASEWFATQFPIEGQKYHSIVMRPQQQISADMLFLNYRGPHGQREPEIYPRPDGTVYVCGEPEYLAIPDDPHEIGVLESSVQALREVASSVSSALAEAQLEIKQACYLPISDDGAPAIGKVPGFQGAYIAAGHGCWGILNGPGTGIVMAELLTEGRATSADIRAMDLKRFNRVFA